MNTSDERGSVIAQEPWETRPDGSQQLVLILCGGAGAAVAERLVRIVRQMNDDASALRRYLFSDLDDRALLVGSSGCGKTTTLLRCLEDARVRFAACPAEEPGADLGGTLALFQDACIDYGGDNVACACGAGAAAHLGHEGNLLLWRALAPGLTRELAGRPGFDGSCDGRCIILLALDCCCPVGAAGEKRGDGGSVAGWRRWLARSLTSGPAAQAGRSHALGTVGRPETSTAGAWLRWWRDHLGPAELPQVTFELASQHRPGAGQPVPILFARPALRSWWTRGSVAASGKPSARHDANLWRIVFHNVGADRARGPSLPDRLAVLLSESPAGLAPRLDALTEGRCRALLGAIKRTAESDPPRPDEVARLYDRLSWVRERASERRPVGHAILWSASELAAFFCNRYFAYDAFLLREQAPGVILLGGLGKALKLAMQTLFAAVFRLPFRLPVGGEGPLLRAVRWFAAAHDVDIVEHHDAGLDAYLLTTRCRKVVYLVHALPARRKASAVCHELAHLCLGHRANSTYGLDVARLDREERELYEQQEQTADALASLWLHLLDGFFDLGHALERSGARVVRFPVEREQELHAEGGMCPGEEERPAAESAARGES
jgi:uncharacterized protein DUF955